MSNCSLESDVVPRETEGDADLISVVLPVHNERDNLAPLIREVSEAMGSVAHEIVAVDDGSSDGSVAALRAVSNEFAQVRVIELPLHAGQSAALIAGIDGARGATIVTLDADGQNDPADIPRLLQLVDESDEVCAVVGVRSKRAANRWKRIQARIANVVRDVITGDRVRDTGCALRVARRTDLRRLPRFRGMHRFIPTLLRRDGVTVLEVPVGDRPRLYGASKYGMWNRVLVGLIDAWGVRWLNRRALKNHRTTGTPVAPARQPTTGLQTTSGQFYLSRRKQRHPS